MKQVWKKRAVVVSVLLLVCAAVYLNWRYTGGVAGGRAADRQRDSGDAGGERLLRHRAPEPQAGA